MVRLFVALDLPADIRERLARMCAGVPGARWLPADNLHLTLRFIGEVDQGVADDLDAALGQISVSPFEIALDGVGTFGKGRKARALWVGLEACPPLARLQAKVEAAVNAAGIPVEERKFTPHITLARLKAPPKGKLNAFVMDNDAFRAGPIPADRFQLYSSFLSASGAIHTVEASYPLKG
jgi:2'-5' RNA ligase